MNWQSFYGGPAPLTPLTGAFGVAAGLVILVVILWTLVWKGMALWKAAKEGSKVWFVVLLIVNTVGILEILYLYVFSRKSGQQPIEPPKM